MKNMGELAMCLTKNQGWFARENVQGKTWMWVRVTKTKIGERQKNLTHKLILRKMCIHVGVKIPTFAINSYFPVPTNVDPLR